MAKGSKRAVRGTTKSRGGSRKNERKKAPKVKVAARKSAKKTAKKIGKRPAKRARHREVAVNTRARKQAPAAVPELPVETAIVDVVEAPVPGVLVVTEFEAVRVTVPELDEDEEETSE